MKIHPWWDCYAADPYIRIQLLEDDDCQLTRERFSLSQLLEHPMICVQFYGDMDKPKICEQDDHVETEGNKPVTHPPTFSSGIWDSLFKRSLICTI